MIWLAVAACTVLVFILGIIVGIWLLHIELRRNGWRVRLQVQDHQDDPT